MRGEEWSERERGRPPDYVRTEHACAFYYNKYTAYTFLY